MHGVVHGGVCIVGCALAGTSCLWCVDAVLACVGQQAAQGPCVLELAGKEAQLVVQYTTCQ